MSLQSFKANVLKSRLFRSSQDDRGRDTGFAGLLPPGRADTPAIARLQAGKVEFGARGREIVPNLAGKGKKCLRDFGADRVGTGVLGAGAAAAIAVESRARGFATRFEGRPENILRHGTKSTRKKRHGKGGNQAEGRFDQGEKTNQSKKMALTPSNMLPLGTVAPDFALPDADGNEKTLSDLRKNARATVVVFWCNHCPYVKHLKPHFANFVKTYQAKGVVFVAINSNDLENYPDDSPEKMKEDIRHFGYTFPYLIDEDQSVAHAYQAACTPDFYAFDADGKLAYRGQYDSSRPGNDRSVTGESLQAALELMIAGVSVPEQQQPSSGCNIKWKRGNEPR